jgi:hypothetical protein
MYNLPPAAAAPPNPRAEMAGTFVHVPLWARRFSVLQKSDPLTAAAANQPGNVVVREDFMDLRNRV